MDSQTTEKKQPEIARRPLYLYDLPNEILSSLALKADAGNSLPSQQLEVEEVEDSKTRANTTDPDDSVIGAQSCSLCSLTFATLQEQRDHLKTDLHHYNLKQKLHGLRPVSETEFEKLVDDLDESISGSDSEDTEDEDDEQQTSRQKDTTLTALLRKQATLADKGNPKDEDGEQKEGRRKQVGAGNAPMLWFNSPKLPDKTYFGIYKALFTPAELEKEDDIINAIRQRQLAPISMPKISKETQMAPAPYSGRHIFMCMIGGGHFAAMVVSLAPKKSKHAPSGPLNREAIVLAHKTFHRYTTRRKQGGSQSANDNAKGNAHSAGASIRRYNEQALVEEVRELLSDWKALIDTSDLLFIRATGTTNRRTLFGPYDGQVLRANDPRVRSIPFATRRATQNELMRCFVELTRLKVKEINEVPVEESKPAESTTTTVSTAPKPPKQTEEELTAQLHTTQLQALIRRSKLPALLSYLKTNNIDPGAFHFYPPDSQQNHHAPTALHLAAAQNSPALVTGLLTRSTADPTVVNAEGKTPFELAGDRATRDAFRVARAELGEERWDWGESGARVPAPLKREEAEQRTERERKEKEAKEAERRRAEEERLKREGPQVPSGGGSSKSKTAGSRLLSGGVALTPQQRREEEARGMTPEMRMRLERERRARAAEERFRRMQAGQSP